MNVKRTTTYRHVFTTCSHGRLVAHLQEDILTGHPLAVQDVVAEYNSTFHVLFTGILLVLWLEAGFMKDHGQQARASENFAGPVDFETPRPDLANLAGSNPAGHKKNFRLDNSIF